MSYRVIAVVCLMMVFGGVAEAQWQEPSSNVVSTTDKVGIGVTQPDQALEVNGNVRSVPANGSFSVGGTAPSGYAFFATSSTSGVPTALQLKSNYVLPSTTFLGNFGEYGTYITHNRDPYLNAFIDAAAPPNQKNAVQLVLGDTMATRERIFSIVNFPGGFETIQLAMKYNGYVGIGPGAVNNPLERLHVDGNIHVSGNINAKYQDIAEWVPSSSDLAPGTVVVLDAALGNGVTASTTPYDTKVAGVVSEMPGLILGEGGAMKEQVATTGRVRVKVDATHAAIAVGDLLVTSDKPGLAMKSIPADLGGLSIHRPGTIVGKALEPLANGQGEILVLLSLQ